jgi:hypothetical protein
MTDFVPLEAFPITGGILVGLVAGRLAPPRLRYPLAGALSAVVAVAAFVLSGEFRVSAEFLLFDLGQAVGAALLTCWLVQVRERRRSLRIRV